MNEETITITKKEYDRLKADAHFLECLQAAGVDNWGGYEQAQDMMGEPMTPQNQELKLLSCPFCGDKPMRSKGYSPYGLEMTGILCSCGARSAYFKTHAEAIKAWNKRANESDATERKSCGELSVDECNDRYKKVLEQLAEANRQVENEKHLRFIDQDRAKQLQSRFETETRITTLLQAEKNELKVELEEARKAIAAQKDAILYTIAHYDGRLHAQNNHPRVRLEECLLATACQDYVKRSALDLANKELKMVCDSRNKIQIELDLRNFSLRQVETKLAAALKVVEATKGFQSAMRQHKEEHATLVHLNQVLESFDVIQNDYQPS